MRGPPASKMTSLLIATLGSSGGVAACLVDSGGLGGLGVVLPCANVLGSFVEFLMIASMFIADSW